jgi:hypothetical protein
VLKKEGWAFLRPTGMRPDALWYLVPGRRATNGILGIDYFKSSESVVQHCKTRIITPSMGRG